MATRQEFAAFMGVLARALPRFAPPIGDKDLLDVWYGELGRLSSTELSHALKQAMRALDQFPSMRQILELAGHAEEKDEDKARDVGERIWTAISRFGNIINATDYARISEFIGPIGDEVVRLQGGWNQICEVTTNENGPMLKAQWRELAATLVRKAKTGELDRPPDFAKLPGQPRKVVPIGLPSNAT